MSSLKFWFYSLGCKLIVSHKANIGAIHCVLVPFREFIWPQHLHTHATCSKMSCGLCTIYIIYTKVNWKSVLFTEHFYGLFFSTEIKIITCKFAADIFWLFWISKCPYLPTKTTKTKTEKNIHFHKPNFMGVQNHIMCYFVCSCLQISIIIHFLPALDQTSQQFSHGC